MIHFDLALVQTQRSPEARAVRAPLFTPALRSCETRLVQDYFQTTVTVLEVDPRCVAVAANCTLK